MENKLIRSVLKLIASPLQVPMLRPGKCVAEYAQLGAKTPRLFCACFPTVWLAFKWLFAVLLPKKDIGVGSIVRYRKHQTTEIWIEPTRPNAMKTDRRRKRRR